MKRTRKAAYTAFLRDHCFYSGYQCPYSGLPKRLKKRLKTWARKWCYYTKALGVVTRWFNPLLLNCPAPNLVKSLFDGTYRPPQISPTTMRFRRYTPNTLLKASL